MAVILVLDPSRALRDALTLALTPEHNVTFCSSLSEVRSFFTQRTGALLIADGALASNSVALQELNAISPLSLLLIDSTFTPVAFPPLPAIEVLAKPFHPLVLREKVRLLLARAPLARQHKENEQQLKRYLSYPYLPSSSVALAEHALRTDSAVHIRGEVGAGKDRIAFALHTLKGKRGRLVSMAASAFCRSALTEVLAADGKDPASLLTLYLKDVENLSPEGQTYLSSLLERGKTEASDDTPPLWVLSSSGADLRERAYRGEFSTELYYVLTLFTLYLPPLRERKGEMAALVEFFAEEAAQRLRLGTVIFTVGAIERIQNHLWFGDMAELEGVVNRTLAVHRTNRIEKEHLLFGYESFLPSFPAVSQTSSASSDPLRPPSFPSLLNALLTKLAHELKNPMVTLKTFAHCVDQAMENEEFRHTFPPLVTEAVDRMDDVLEEVLEFSHLAGTAPSPQVNFKALVQEVIQGRKGFSLEWPEGESLLSDVGEEQIRFALQRLCDAIAESLPLGQPVLLRGEATCLTFFFPQEIALSWQHLADLAGNGGHSSFSLLPLRLILARIFFEQNGVSLQWTGKGVTLQHAPSPVLSPL